MRFCSDNEKTESSDVAIQNIKGWIATSVDFPFAKLLREKLRLAMTIQLGMTVFLAVLLLNSR